MKQEDYDALLVGIDELWRAVRGVVPAPPPEGPWRVTYSGDTKWWVRNKHQEFGPMFYEPDAIAVRDALNQVAAAVRAVPAPQEGPP